MTAYCHRYYSFFFSYVFSSVLKHTNTTKVGKINKYMQKMKSNKNILNMFNKINKEVFFEK